MILKEALQSSTGIETTPLNPYVITFKKAKDVVPSIVTKFLEFFIGKANKSTSRLLRIAQDLYLLRQMAELKHQNMLG